MTVAQQESAANWLLEVREMCRLSLQFHLIILTYMMINHRHVHPLTGYQKL